MHKKRVKPICIGSGTDKMIKRIESRAPKPTPPYIESLYMSEFDMQIIGERRTIYSVKLHRQFLVHITVKEKLKVMCACFLLLHNKLPQISSMKQICYLTVSMGKDFRHELVESSY